MSDKEALDIEIRSIKGDFAATISFFFWSTSSWVTHSRMSCVMASRLAMVIRSLGRAAPEAAAASVTRRLGRRLLRLREARDQLLQGSVGTLERAERLELDLADPEGSRHFAKPPPPPPSPPPTRPPSPRWPLDLELEGRGGRVKQGEVQRGGDELEEGGGA
eukprot:8392428-Pyramimonas_sp.AAC.1